jgi:hypothetical protein
VDPHQRHIEKLRKTQNDELVKVHINIYIYIHVYMYICIYMYIFRCI